MDNAKEYGMTMGENERIFFNNCISFSDLERLVSERKKHDLIVNFLKAIGLYEEPVESQLAKDVREILLVEYDGLVPLVIDRVSIVADLVIEKWSQEKTSGIKLLLLNCYDDGEPVEAEYRMLNDRAVRNNFHLLLRYQGTPLCLHFELDQENNVYYWVIKARGPASERFFQDFNARISEFIVAQKKGKALNIDLEEINIKTPELKQLVYPEETSDRIAAFVQCFHNWLKSPFINRWGGIFIGPPGTGKTTVGSFLAAQRPPECTVIYVAASSIQSEKQIEALFYWASKLSPTLVIIDDFDLISQDRRYPGDKGITGALMAKMDGLEEHGKIFTVLTTNDPSTIETAIFDRPGRVFEKIELDNFLGCFLKLMKKYAEIYQINATESDLSQAVDIFMRIHSDFKGFSPDAVKIICQKIHMEFLEKPLMAEDILKKCKIVYDDFYSKKR